MKRRLYFLLPDTEHTRAVVNDLKVFGINTDTMHTLAKPGVDLQNRLQFHTLMEVHQPP